MVKQNEISLDGYDSKESSYSEKSEILNSGRIKI